MPTHQFIQEEKNRRELPAIWDRQRVNSAISASVLQCAAESRTENRAALLAFQHIANGFADDLWRSAMGKDETQFAVRRDQIGGGGMIDGVTERGILEFHFIILGTIQLGRLGDFLWLSGDADEIGVEVIDILVQQLKGIPLGIHTDKHAHHLLQLVIVQLVESLCHVGKGSRTYIRAFGIAKIQQHHFSPVVFETERPLAGLQGKITTGRCIGNAGHIQLWSCLAR